ncbi:hypothetical protein CF54_00275 [Streptomyces sp. F-3]|jgi:hypothetical protein|uniref:Integral membrane protein n=1 Tax=Streptomyces thermogriseus TaxID=75292 RepID=A0ABN1STN1_9ACTN|nr:MULTISPECIES: hypothetical protein [Streptomyces]MDN5380542.1 hypothetical protein [Streptomyces sp. LB8]GAT82287.1 hypothetical protein CF54_00275 [Streptomyces sp. F-3]
MQEAHRPQSGASSGENSRNDESDRSSENNGNSGIGGSGASGAETGGGLGPTVALLVVSLVAAAVGVYLLSGFGLHSLDPRPRLFRAGLTTAGVIVATVVAGAAAGNLIWLLTVSRRRTGTGGTPSVQERASTDG